MSASVQGGQRKVLVGRRLATSAPGLQTVHLSNLNSPAVQLVRISNDEVYGAPTVTAVRTTGEEGYDLNPQYNFGYSITDSVTGDSKRREESRDGDVVRGSYSVADPDGRIRTVTYTADALHGFQAKVTYDGAEGPVAIPFNPAPHSAVPVAQPAVPSPAPIVASQAALPEETIIAARAPAQTQTSRRTLAPQQFPVFPAVDQAHVGHVVHTVDGPQVVAGRNFPVLRQPTAVHALHATPAFSVVRQGEHPAHAVHAVHTAPAFTTVRQFPQIIQQGAPVRSLFNDNGLDLSQFRFISPVSLIQQ